MGLHELLAAGLDLLHGNNVSCLVGCFEFGGNLGHLRLHFGEPVRVGEQLSDRIQQKETEREDGHRNREPPGQASEVVHAHEDLLDVADKEGLAFAKVRQEMLTSLDSFRSRFGSGFRGRLNNGGGQISCWLA